MGKVLKEIILMLLVCLLGMLLFAVLFYKYIPNRKVIPEVKNYSSSAQIQEQLADDVDQRNDKIIKTYEVTSSDLSNYKSSQEYVPGKANPFASVTQNPESGATTNTTGGGTSTGGSTKENGTSRKTIIDSNTTSTK